MFRASKQRANKAPSGYITLFFWKKRRSAILIGYTEPRKNTGQAADSVSGGFVRHIVSKVLRENLHLPACSTQWQAACL